MVYQLHKISVGPWPMNSYILTCSQTGKSVLIDPGADAQVILSRITSSAVTAILITHTHPDHIGALAEVRQATAAPVYIHPQEALHGKLAPEFDLYDGISIPVGNLTIRAIHTPGHTPGMTCFDWGVKQILVGDTIFVGGPGKTWSSKDFQTTIQTMQNIVFQWSDDTRFHPGHGPSGVIGEERPLFEGFLSRGWSKNLHGDVTWD